MASVVCYTGEGAKRDGVHTPRQFLRTARRVCKRDCPPEGDVRAWADWAGADLLGPNQDSYCRYMHQGADFFRQLAGPLSAGRDVTISQRGRFVVITDSGKSTKLPLRDLSILKEWMEVFRGDSARRRRS